MSVMAETRLKHVAMRVQHAVTHPTRNLFIFVHVGLQQTGLRTDDEGQRRRK